MKFPYLKGLLVSAFVLTAVGVGGLLSIGSLRSVSHQIADETIPSLGHLALANQNRGQTFLRLLVYLSEKDFEKWDAYRKEIETLSEKGDQELKKYEEAIRTPTNRELFDKYISARSAYIGTREEVFKELESSPTDASWQKVTKSLLPRYEAYLDAGNELVNYTVRQGQNRGEQIEKISLFSQIGVVIICIGLFVLGFIFGYSR